MARHLLIVNVHSGGGRTARRTKEWLARLPADLDCDTVVMQGPGHAAEVAEEAAPRYDTVIALGGDGTVCEVATGLLHSGSAATRLAILPAGTGNDAAHAIGIPDLETGLSALRGEATRAVDVCEVTYTVGDETRRRLSLVGSGIGFPAEVVARATTRVKRLLRHWAYYYAAFAAAAAYRAPRMRITADGALWTGRYIMVAVANVERTSAQRMRMAPGARCDDGLMHVILVEDASKLRLLSQLPRLSAGTHLDLPEVRCFTAHEVRVECDPPVRLNIDGDLEGETPAAFRILPRALTVRVPEKV